MCNTPTNDEAVTIKYYCAQCLKPIGEYEPVIWHESYPYCSEKCKDGDVSQRAREAGL